MPAFQAAMQGTGADLRSVALSDLPTYRWFAEHDYDTGTTRNERSDQGAYRGFIPVLTPDQRKARIVFLGSMEPRHQLRVIEQLEDPWLVAGDTMKLYIREQPEALEPVLKRLDYLFLNASEAMALARSRHDRGSLRAVAPSLHLARARHQGGPRAPPSTGTATTFTSPPCRSTRRRTRPGRGTRLPEDSWDAWRSNRWRPMRPCAWRSATAPW